MSSSEKQNEKTAGLETRLKELTAELEKKQHELDVEVALEKVRIKASAMHSSEELAETSAVLFSQLNELGIRALRTSVGIFDDANDAMELWVTGSQDGTVVRVLDYVNLHVHPVFENIIPARQKKEPFALTILDGMELKAYYQDVGTYLHIPKPKRYNEREYYYAFFFTEGSINVVTDHELSKTECQVMTRFAFAFGLVYTRFLELQKAEKNLEELIATQSQLIQSEKMASLGELTAGIAHEIQNPLNFVKNFSEVNSELIAELIQALESGNSADALEIARSIQTNEEKLILHGARAGNIVKSMLLHSRPTGSNREPTNINALADEYLQLCYHGLRAKNNSSIARYQTDYDPSIGRIVVNPQDIGRVMLNLLSNAFHAVTERLKLLEPGYQPRVWIATKRLEDSVIITVRDNGLGIPGTILGKIFQPFFTTKPTGEGTGLGLSLAYDIITKGHGGDLLVDTKEGEGTIFTISLPAGLFQ